MFFIILPNKKIIKFISSIMIINLIKYFNNDLLINFTIKSNGFFVKKCFLLIKNSFIDLFYYKDMFQLSTAKIFYKYLVAYSIKILFPFSILGFGNSVENGFYYDFEIDFRLSFNILKKIERKMILLLEFRFSNFMFFFNKKNFINLFFINKYKNDLIDKNDIYIYKYGSFLDFSYEFNFENLYKFYNFELVKVSGAYWLSDSLNIMLQRIEGNFFDSFFKLDKNLSNNIIDHRLLSRKYDLFHFQADTCGVIFWHKNGWIIYQEIIKYLRYIFNFYEYIEVNTPQLMNKNLWEISGHLDKFFESMYFIFSDDDVFLLKPMNCPAHVQIFKNSIKSYKDLPIKYCEFGSCHRKEFSGSLHGIMRVKNFVQDDGHIFCSEYQIQKEVILFIKSLFIVYKKFQFKNILVKLSTRPKKRVGNDLIWDKAEKSLILALDKLNLDYVICKEEGAFYGPKIEFTLKDNIGRLWQCGTIQIDFFIPKRLCASYFNRFGLKQFPIILHRAIIGSIERFFGILLENNSFNFPFWLCPIQIIVLSITFFEIHYSKKIVEILKKENFRVTFDFKNDKISFKIRNAITKKIPYLIIIGKNEVINNFISVRHKEEKNLGVMKIDFFINMIKLLFI